MGALRDALALVASSSSSQRTRAQPTRAARVLVQGDHFKMHRDTCKDEREAQVTWEVLRVTPGSAMVRALATRTVTIKDPETGAVKASWSAPSGIVGISTQASVLLLPVELE